MQWGLGRSGTGLLVIANANEVQLAVEIKSQQHPTWFGKLLDDKEAIERELGFALDWQERPDKKDSRLMICKLADTRSPGPRAATFQWLLERMVPIARVFRPRIKALDDMPSPEQNADA